MIKFRKENKIEFVSLVQGVSEMFPVTAARSYKPKWAESAVTEYKSMIKDQVNFNHISLCPGIFDLFKTGYIVHAWHDTLIKTNGDGHTFQWAVPNFDSLEITGVTQPVGSHTEDITKFLPQRPHSLKGVVKFNTPWRIIAPKGVKFLMLPIEYSDDHLFDAAMGILDPEVSNEINVQVYWNKLNGEHKIKAGTPLCQLIPLSEKQFKLVVRDATQHDLDWEKKKDYINGSTFFPQRKKLAEMWRKHFKI